MAALAIVTVDQKGRPAGDNPVAVSSFGYGFKKACLGKFDALKEWPEVERKLIAQLNDFLIRHDAETGEILPLEQAQIAKSSSWLSTGFDIPTSHYVKPEFAVRAYQWFMAPNPPEPLLLNSFFLEDLAGARRLVEQEKGGGKGLRRFMGIEKPDNQTDLIEDRNSLEKVLAPKNVPIARWPAKNSHSLVVLQQAAVNLAFRELSLPGILGVNGPPGTGKTTLLRDLVAGVVAQRAEALYVFEDPETAFKHADKIRFGNSFSHLYKIDQLLVGHEILVASANNKAVENVSREIPELRHVEADRAPNYFSSIANHVAGDDTETWGLAAAVLGNAANRSSFYNKFWKDPDHGLQQYLWACQGRDTDDVTTDEETGEEIRRVRPVIAAENPPRDKQEALERWQAERERYIRTVKNAEKDLENLEKLRELLKALSSVEAKLHGIQAQLEEQRFSMSTQSSVFQHAVHILSGLKTEHETSLNAITMHRTSRPGILSRLVFSKASRNWRSIQSDLTKDAKRRKRKLIAQKTKCADEKDATDAIKGKVRALESAAGETNAQVLEQEKALEGPRALLGAQYADDLFWKASHDDFQRSVAWLNEETQKKRDLCFAAAFDLHKAFIGAAAKPIRNNVRALFSVILGGGIDQDKRALLQSLWSTLFLTVPVVSTTFASVTRMLGPLEPESLGWLLIDEAGQASPQMAVGAIMRSKRTLVVGDPLQIEPVVTLSSDLVSRIAGKFGVNHKDWMAPWSSVQALADTASDYAAWIEQKEGSIRVGAPLLVHRRCEEPMFSISNTISYGNLMVQATVSGGSAIRDALGRSRWIDVVGPSSTKWCADEGEVVIEMLRSIVAAQLDNPDVFIISPFRIVAQSMRRRLRRESDLLRSLSSGNQKWLYDRVGTVHTFQGKQAEAVILLLGAQGAEHTFARQWASRPPNLINVAVSRSKSALYVVGNRTLWKDVGCLSEVCTRL